MEIRLPSTDASVTGIFLQCKDHVKMKQALLLLSCLLFINTANAWSLCPRGLYSYGRQCYKIMHMDSTWSEAKVLCESMDANLVEINDPMKEHFLFTTILQKDSVNADRPLWIGASDMLTENSWVWVKSKRRMTFRNWRMRLVDALKEGHGHCLALQTLPQFEWKEVKCTERHGFICEFDPMLY